LCAVSPWTSSWLQVVGVVVVVFITAAAVLAAAAIEN
jgi:hypothetical protein